MNSIERIACMGGRCVRRESCAAYQLEGVARLAAAERLCRDGADYWRPVVFRPRQVEPVPEPETERGEA